MNKSSEYANCTYTGRAVVKHNHDWRFRHNNMYPYFFTGKRIWYRCAVFIWRSCYILDETNTVKRTRNLSSSLIRRSILHLHLPHNGILRHFEDFTPLRVKGPKYRFSKTRSLCSLGDLAQLDTDNWYIVNVSNKKIELKCPFRWICSRRFFT